MNVTRVLPIVLVLVVAAVAGCGRSDAVTGPGVNASQPVPAGSSADTIPASQFPVQEEAGDGLGAIGSGG